MEEGTILFGNTPTTFMFFPLIGVVCIMAYTASYALRRYRAKQEIDLGAVGWSIFFSAILVIMTLWCALGYVDSTEIYWIQCTAILAFGGACITLRDQLLDRFDRAEARGGTWSVVAQVARILRDLALLFVASEFARLALEIPSNDVVYNLPSNSVVIEFSIIFLTSLLTYFIGQRRAAGPVICVIVAYFIGLAEYFVVDFKQNAILPMELFALRTAADVSDQYTYILNTNALRGLTCASVALVALSLIRPSRVERPKRIRMAETAVNLSLAAACVVGLSWWFTGFSYHDDLGYTISYWNSPNTYRQQGIFPSFLTALEDMPLHEPEGYDHDEAVALTASYAERADDMPERTERRKLSEKQYADEQPSVVIVMNETFADLSRIDELRVGYQGPQFYKSIDDAVRKGQVAVSVYGAGTCNTEFEVLTGNSLAFVGAGQYPYQMFDRSKTANLARQFKEQGYATTAIHPNKGDNWNRNTVYEALGFDRFLSTDNDFEGEPIFHNGHTDRSTYTRILAQLQDTSAPQFVFDVTMQNHGGYKVGNIPAERLTTFQPQGFTADDLAQLNEYLSCIQASDEDLEWFVGELRRLERPVVLVFFGDHHPKMSNTYNDAFFDASLESAADHQARIYMTEYLIWSNYDVEGSDEVSRDETVGSDCLGALTLDLIGAPLDEFQRAQLSVHQRLQAINTIGFEGTDGRWHVPGSASYLDVVYRDMQKMDYLRFGEDIE